MTAILGGLAAAMFWAVSTLSSSRSSRIIGGSAAVAWVMIVGFVLVLPFAMRDGIPAALDWQSGGWLVLGGLGSVVGLLFMYAGLRQGKVGVVAPIASTEGAVAALIAVGAGERIAPVAAVMLAVITLGIVLSAAVREPGLRIDSEPTRRAAALAIVAAMCFGVSLYGSGRAGEVLPVSWVLVSARAIGVVVLALPLVASNRLALTRPALPLVLVSGVCEVVGFVAFIVAARHGIAISAVLGSQFAAIAALVALILFRERLMGVQYAGLCVIAVGVTVLSAAQG